MNRVIILEQILERSAKTTVTEKFPMKGITFFDDNDAIYLESTRVYIMPCKYWGVSSFIYYNRGEARYFVGEIKNIVISHKLDRVLVESYNGRVFVFPIRKRRSDFSDLLIEFGNSTMSMTDRNGNELKQLSSMNLFTLEKDSITQNLLFLGDAVVDFKKILNRLIIFTTKRAYVLTIDYEKNVCKFRKVLKCVSKEVHNAC